ncbi:phosphate/phosphite/phosphonate ABC transporter substrate-binding protein [Porticoccaceae bacterium LTM1]|nr:phosphate/phosphite/phosphonate ABC transporter substrate-binding protein [Porticoccaceae bacterium LTM1]
MTVFNRVLPDARLTDIRHRSGSFVCFCVSLFMCVTLLFCSQTQAEPGSRVVTPENRSTTFIIGKVTHNPKKHYPRLMVMAQYLLPHLKELGYERVEVRLAKSVDGMTAMLKNNQVDLVTDTPFSALKFEKEAGAELLLLKWKKGVREYHSLIVVHKDSDIYSLEDLKGKVVAFEDRGSTSAYLLPRYALQKAGLKLQELESPREVASHPFTGFVFSQAEQNTAAWVESNWVDAGCISNLDFEKPDHILPHQKESFRVIYQSDPVPRAFEIVRPGLPEKVKSRLSRILLNMPNDPAAVEALKAYQRTTKFEEITELDRKALKELQSLGVSMTGSGL